MPEPYFYKAETGIFGPFDAEKMHAWNQGGFFARDLLVGRKKAGPYAEIGKIAEFALATDLRSASSPGRSPVAVVGERLRNKSFAIAAQEDDAMSAALAQAKQLFETSVITHDQYKSIMKAHGKFTSWKSNETDSATAATVPALAVEAPQSHGAVALPLGTCTLCKEQVAMHLFSEHRCSGGGAPSGEMECDVASIDVGRVIGEFGSASQRLARGARSVEGLIESAQRETSETLEYVSTKRMEVSSLRAECEALKVEIAELRAEAEGYSSPQRRGHGRSRSAPNSASPRSEPCSGSSSPRQQVETRKQRRPSATQLLRKKLGLSPKSSPG